VGFQDGQSKVKAKMAGLGHVIEPHFFSYVLNRHSFYSSLNFSVALNEVHEIAKFNQIKQFTYTQNDSFDLFI
jgi:hypothetical protein